MSKEPPITFSFGNRVNTVSSRICFLKQQQLLQNAACIDNSELKYGSEPYDPTRLDILPIHSFVVYASRRRHWQWVPLSKLLSRLNQCEISGLVESTCTLVQYLQGNLALNQITGWIIPPTAGVYIKVEPAVFIKEKDKQFSLAFITKGKSNRVYTSILQIIHAAESLIPGIIYQIKTSKSVNNFFNQLNQIV